MGQSERRFIHSDNLRPVTPIKESAALGGSISGTKTILGVHINPDRVEREQHDSGSGDLRPVSNSLYFTIVKRFEKMATAKMMLFFFDFFGIPLFLYTSILNFGEFKGWVLFFIAALYGLARLFFFVDKQRDESRMRKLQLKKKEHDVYEEINED